jgi:hypothetical protein
MLRNNYNCFADPVFGVFIMIIVACLVPLRFILNLVAGYMKIWEINIEGNVRVDIGAMNRLDKDNNMIRLVRNI